MCWSSDANCSNINTRKNRLKYISFLINDKIKLTKTNLIEEAASSYDEKFNTENHFNKLYF